MIERVSLHFQFIRRPKAYRFRGAALFAKADTGGGLADGGVRCLPLDGALAIDDDHAGGGAQFPTALFHSVWPPRMGAREQAGERDLGAELF